MGGGQPNVNKAVEMDINTGRWRYLADMLGRRNGHGCTVVGRKVVVAGGFEDMTSEILDLDTEQWSRAGDLTTWRYRSRLVTLNDRVILLGGEHRDGSSMETVEELDMGQGTWRRLGVRMKTPRAYFAATVMDRRDLCN